jgi:CheY-like chemotaxis protein
MIQTSAVDPMKQVEYIVLIDDDDITNRLHCMLLEDLNVAKSIHVATEGEEALDFLDQLFEEKQLEPKCCLVFLDINMPGLSGFELLEAIAQREKLAQALQVYLLTSSSSRRDIDMAARYDVAGYLDKPLTEEKIRQAMLSLAK